MGRGRLVDFTYRFGHWRGQIGARFENGDEVVHPFREFSDYQNLYFFSQRKCHHCIDHTGYHGDISAGDIWSRRMRDNPTKHTALIARTDVGERVVQDALRAGALVGEAEPVEEVLDGQARTLPFHYNISARAKVGGLLGETIKDTVGERVRWNDYIVAFIVLMNERISRTRLGRAVIFRIPRPLSARVSAASERPGESLKNTPLQVAVIGATVWGNRGAEAMLCSTIGQVRRRWPDATFWVYSYYPAEDRARIVDEKVQVLDGRPFALVAKHLPFALLGFLFRLVGLDLPDPFLSREMRALRQCSVLLDIPGITFSDGRAKYLPIQCSYDLASHAPGCAGRQALPGYWALLRALEPACWHAVSCRGAPMSSPGGRRPENTSRTWEEDRCAGPGRRYRFSVRGVVSTLRREPREGRCPRQPLEGAEGLLWVHGGYFTQLTGALPIQEERSGLHRETQSIG